MNKHHRFQFYISLLLRHRILTVQHGEAIWRSIPCDVPYPPVTYSICLNGKIYYGAVQKSNCIVVCVDLTSESLFTKVLPLEFPLLSLTTKLTSFDGQPSFTNDAGFDLNHTGEFKLCLMDKVSLEWVVKGIHVTDWKQRVSTPFSFLGTIPSGELVFARDVLEGGRQVLLYYNRDNETLYRYEI
ncbi:unnamed protein product [Eruca vesicaria subsp. sativa]|uniref:F-box associated beta-propeller type 3 domain-containing protein n=1 Tax=Eruca vesicaria subsp. sativa TaxID=29727 RepID=A0ABC8KHX1_ERUVS|nr:unnamed protein product [Eruca vesicaria subsp. sativa]